MNNGDMSVMDEQVLDERRLERRRRRRRNQRIAYLILAGVMVVASALIFITVYSLNRVFKFVKPNGGDLVAAAEMSSDPFTWQAVPWHSMIRYLPTGSNLNCV